MVTDPGEVARIESLLKRKYGLEFWVVLIVETIAARGRKPRVLLRVALSDRTHRKFGPGFAVI